MCVKTMKKITTICLSLLFLFSIVVNSTAAKKETFDVRQHLSTVTRYEVGKGIKENEFVPAKVPDHCTPIHLNLVARHGTRSPTKKKIKELDDLSSRLKELLQNAKETGSSLEKVPSWLPKWSSPWKGTKGEELLSQGEEEMYHLGKRIMERFQGLFTDEYHPDIYQIRATEIPRTSASAVAFGMGMFSGKGELGAGKHRAFSVTNERRDCDIMLRFHACCQTYKDYKEHQEPAVAMFTEPVLDKITSSLGARYGLNFTVDDTSKLWYLCKQEASLLGVTDQACDLFSQDEVKLLEWTDDLKLFIVKGYGGNPLNYRMGVPLLKDVILSMENAIKAKEEGRAPGSYEKARLRFAHAETLVPFSCLIGLFIEGSEFDQIKRGEPLKNPPKPPKKRTWRGSTVAPFSGNNALVLYSCSGKSTSGYYVKVLHNEQPIPVAGCGGTDFCPFEVFKKKVVDVHLKHSFDNLCNANMEKQWECKSYTRKFTELFSWIFSGKNKDISSGKAEL